MRFFTRKKIILSTLMAGLLVLSGCGRNLTKEDARNALRAEGMAYTVMASANVQSDLGNGTEEVPIAFSGTASVSGGAVLVEGRRTMYLRNTESSASESAWKSGEECMHAEEGLWEDGTMGMLSDATASFLSEGGAESALAESDLKKDGSGWEMSGKGASGTWPQEADVKAEFGEDGTLERITVKASQASGSSVELIIVPSGPALSTEKPGFDEEDIEDSEETEKTEEN